MIPVPSDTVSASKPMSNTMAENVMVSWQSMIAGPSEDVTDHHSRARRREEEHQLRRNRRAAVSDRLRAGLKLEQHSVPSLGELQRWPGSDGTSLLAHSLLIGSPRGATVATADSLRRLKGGLAAGSEHRQAFSEPDGLKKRLDALIIALKDEDPDMQLEAAACFTNWALVPMSDEVVRAAAPYLITLANGVNHLLQSQCIWALGNMCCSGAEICRLLARQGMPTAAASCLNSLYSYTRDSAAQAVAAFVTHAEESDARWLAFAILPLLPPLISLDSTLICLCASTVVDCAVEATLCGDSGDILRTNTSATMRNERSGLSEIGSDVFTDDVSVQLVKQDDSSMDTEVCQSQGPFLSEDSVTRDNNVSLSICSDHSSSVNPQVIQNLTSILGRLLLEGLARKPAPPHAVISLLLRTLTSLSRLPSVVVVLLSRFDTARTLTLLLQHDSTDLRRETLALVANLLYVELAVDGRESEVVDVDEVEQRRDCIRIKLSYQLGTAFKGLRSRLSTIEVD